MDAMATRVDLGEIQAEVRGLARRIGDGLRPRDMTARDDALLRLLELTEGGGPIGWEAALACDYPHRRRTLHGATPGELEEMEGDALRDLEAAELAAEDAARDLAVIRCARALAFGGCA